MFQKKKIWLGVVTMTFEPQLQTMTHIMGVYTPIIFVRASAVKWKSISFAIHIVSTWYPPSLHRNAVPCNRNGDKVETQAPASQTTKSPPPRV